MGSASRSVVQSTQGRATIREVAELAGVGIGTVSRVLNGNQAVSEATRQRVEAAITQLRYRPHWVARALSRRRAGAIQVVVPVFARFFYVEILRGIEDVLADTDIALFLRSVERPNDREQIFRQIVCGQIDGLLIVSLRLSSETRTLLHTQHVPTLLLDAPGDMGLPAITIDHRLGGYLATTHLLQLGHRRIALIDHSDDPADTGRPSGREVGYRQALHEAGVVLPPSYCIQTAFSPEAGEAALQTLLSLAEPPTAVFVGSDTQALGVLEGLRRRGRRVPEDFAVVGYNDIDVANFLGLTTVRVPMRELGRRGMTALLALLEQPEAALALPPIQPELIVRTSCGAKRPSAPIP